MGADARRGDEAGAQRRLLARAMDLVPGATLDELVLPEPVALVPRRASGSRLQDVEGREYTDYTLGGGSLILGHAHPDVVAAVCEQARRGSSFAMLSEPLLELAEVLVEAIPCAEQVLFAATGAEATYLALRLARAATGRPGVLKFAGGYHGHHDIGVLSVTGTGSGPEPVVEVSGTSPRSLEEVWVAPFNDVERTAALLAAHRNALAAVILEPVQRVVAPRPEFLAMLRAETRRHGIVLIFDEIVTGFRFDYRGAQGLYHVVPDLATYGKVLGGGYPLSAIAGPRDLLRLANPRGGPAAFSGSQHGNAVAAAAGLTTLRRLRQPGSFERLQALTHLMERTLKRAVAAAGVEGRVVVLGPVWHVLPFVPGDGPFEDHRASLPADPRRAQAGIAALSRELTARGVLAFPRPLRGYVRGYLSLAHSEEDIERTGGRLQEALRQASPSFA
ncbi:MAG: aminotransferase class III-fold pyridoxal phosphate-dependent enzyme [Candidatus Rokubacteria bacterium]|nr:aminotransferase class III-fold pyridoxal phosphate-dependent enzyme [Candidatus Rokubacteria bacterium]